MTLVGVAFRPELSEVFTEPGSLVQCTELIADRYFGTHGFRRVWELRGLEGVPTIVHGLCGNAASVSGPDNGYLSQIKQLADAIGAMSYSDHLAFTGVAERALGHLSPNLYDETLLLSACGNIARMGERTGRRVQLENLATNVTISGAMYTPEEFYLRLLELSSDWDCLLDLTNVWINSRGRPVDPVAFIEAIPSERIGYVHLAGGKLVHGQWIDSHSNAVHTEVFELLDHLLSFASPRAIIIERDANWSGAADELRSDLATARRLVDKHQATAATTSKQPGRVAVSR